MNRPGTSVPGRVPFWSALTPAVSRGGVVIDISDVQGDDRALPLVMVAAITWLRELLTADVPTSSSTVGLGIEFEDADNFVVRVHPEDAERYSLPEEIFLEFDERTSRSQAVFQREEAGPVSYTHLTLPTKA